jgi:hypothetical protein
MLSHSFVLFPVGKRVLWCSLGTLFVFGIRFFWYVRLVRVVLFSCTDFLTYVITFVHVILLWCAGFCLDVGPNGPTSIQRTFFIFMCGSE